MTGQRRESPAEEGRALMVRESGPAASLSEQLAGLFYKLTWRTPLHNMRLTGKLPPRLYAVPDDPLPGDPVRGDALRAGRFLFRGIQLPFDKVEDRLEKLPSDFQNYIHRFAWLRDLAAVASRAQGTETAERLMDAWLDHHGMKVAEPAWRADNCAWRFVNWAAHAPYILSSSDLIYRSRVLNAIARNARHLDRAAQRAPEGRHRLVAWAGLVAAALLIPDGKARKIVGEAGLEKAIASAIFPDGGIVSRSPLALVEAIHMLSLLRDAYGKRKEMIPAFIDQALERAVPALTGLTHADGGLGAWQGSGVFPPDELNALIGASGVRARPARQARDWGYQRVTAGRSVLQLDAAPPPLARESAVGCASTLALEFSHGPDRIIVNCGGAALVGKHVSQGLATGLRSTAAHSTLCLADSNSTSILPGGKLGRGVEEVELDRREGENATRIEASHDGYSRTFGFVHRRLLMLRDDGMELRGEDMLLPAGSKRKKTEATPFVLRFHLGDGIEAQATENGAVLRLPSGGLWQFRLTGGTLAIEDSLWVDADGRPHPTTQLAISGAAEAGGSSLGWLLKHMG
ncbi:heparinase II/III family protein [Novosphingopyxis iocasae]|uniref:heparinase II/III family protein n=1 Tax=Novosphingopyxis iocasae TaxID=2762729 RepID=UPI0016519EC2|nr:heparinase II/III family protein [Novosphingopyxis iocasae]